MMHVYFGEHDLPSMVSLQLQSIVIELSWGLGKEGSQECLQTEDMSRQISILEQQQERKSIKPTRKLTHGI